ncbi:MAG: flagellar motor switch protein FliM [Oscillospiraceae bacterium]|nr:flagellar motor switch protein FliM [Oscillospiraceae bacterium]
MPEKLSQDQIDALLNRMTAGEDVQEEINEGKKIKEYDFRSPKKFTKEQLRALDSMYENYCRMLSSYLSGVLRVFCEVSVLTVEEQRYFEYNNALPDNGLVCLMDLKPAADKYSEGTLLMDMSTTIGFLMIDRLLGGSGEGYNFDRDFTDIEVRILENIFGKLIRQLKDVWCNYVEVDIGFSSIETNPRLMQALAPEDIVVIVALNVKIKDLTGTLSVCIPAANLEEMIDRFSMRYSRLSKRQSINAEKLSEERKRLIFGSLVDSALEIKAVLTETQLDLKEILQLQIDDVIPLNKNINGNVEVLVDGESWFDAKLGETKTKKAIKLNQRVDAS